MENGLTRPSAASLLDGPALSARTPAPAAQPNMREFGDPLATRKAIYDSVFEAAGKIAPVEDDRYSLSLSNVAWADPERFSRRQRKLATLTGETVARRLKGTWELRDKATGDVVDRRDQVVARVPYLSSLGTFIHRGNEYSVSHQQRLLPGVFARTMDNGELESHFNVLPGKGVSHRYFIDPKKSLFKLRVAQAEIPVMPLLRAMGATDREIRDAWGDEIWQANYGKSDEAALLKLKQKFLPRKEHGLDAAGSSKRLAEIFSAMELDPAVTRRTLGKEYANAGKETILAATRKLLAVSRGEADPDDRDHLAYQRFYGPEDLFAERISRDHGRHRLAAFRKISSAGNLSKMPSGLLTPQIEQVFLGSGLAQALEETNPIEVLDKLTKITRMGEGGIPSDDSIPMEARSVQPSHLGFVDPVRTPESQRAGVDLHMARGARKGADGKIYTQLRNKKGALEWKTPQDVADMAVATPDVLRWDTKRVPVMKGGKIAYVPKEDIDYVVPQFEDAFSPLANLIPLKAMVKGQRVAMGSRYLTQSLPLRDAQAPYVQGAVPGTDGRESFEERYGAHMGAVAADQDGRVEDIRDGVVRLRLADGSAKEIELYDNQPLNRKTAIHQTPMVQPGQTFKKGQVLVRSNYTDDKGATALGANFRVAYTPYKGYNFEDAQVISESAAKRFTSEGMYLHETEITDRHKVGKKAFRALFPAKYDRDALGKLDDRGVVQVGQTVNFGEPLILSAVERDSARNKVHKKGQAGYQDASVTWDHHDPGVVTDVVWGKKGPVVSVKSYSQMRVGDKLSGRYGDKGVVAAIVPDDQMPVGPDGKPYEILLNPLGIITRTNPSQKAEAALGKIAEKLGTTIKVPDFDDSKDMTAWVQEQLKQHGLKDVEDVLDPETGRKVPGVYTGNRFFMKLSHTAESKAQGRGSGAYSSDGTPAKGGEAGCFTGGVALQAWFDGETHPRPSTMAEVCTSGVPCRVLSRGGWERVTDYFSYRVLPGVLMTITLDDGGEIHCTPDHEFVLADGTRKRARELTVEDELAEGPWKASTI